MARPFVPSQTNKSEEVTPREAPEIIQLMSFLCSEVTKLNPFPVCPCHENALLPFNSSAAFPDAFSETT
jgi:hypothetical protein